MSNKNPFKKMIWAYDPFEGSNETHQNVAKVLGYLTKKPRLRFCRCRCTSG